MRKHSLTTEQKTTFINIVNSKLGNMCNVLKPCFLNLDKGTKVSN